MSIPLSDRPVSAEPSAALWLEWAARALYAAERAAHPERHLPAWALGNRVLCADARYRAQGAYQRSEATVKAVLVEHVAQTLATVDGVVWPACESPIRPQVTSPEHAAAMCAERRQHYRHKARLVIAAHDRYLDIDAAAEPEAQRVSILARAKAQQLADVAAVQTWQRQREQCPNMQAETGEGRY